MKTRLAKRSDLNKVTPIIKEAYGTKEIPVFEEEFKSMFKKSNIRKEFFVISEGKEILGIGGFSQSFINFYSYEICWINVRKKHRNKGVGQRIMKALIRRIKIFKGDNKAKFITLTAKNTGLYDKFGFKVLHSYVGNDGADDNLMMLEL